MKKLRDEHGKPHAQDFCGPESMLELAGHARIVILADILKETSLLHPALFSCQLSSLKLQVAA